VAIALERADCSPDEAVMVGDTGWDVEAAARCRVSAIGLLTGGWAEAELRAAGARWVYPDLVALLADLSATPLGGR
jgi:phosphoglycolate phosphatase-like HAD superfamily hydrolase